MALSKSDLSAIRNIVVEEITPIKSDIAKLKKGQKKIEIKFDKLFNFLDKEFSYFKRKVANKLGINVNELNPPLR